MQNEKTRPQIETTFAYRLMAERDMLQEHPEIGRSVPEHRSQTIREIIFNSYRIVYRVQREQKQPP